MAESLLRPHRPLTRTFPLSSKTPCFPYSGGPISNWLTSIGDVRLLLKSRSVKCQLQKRPRGLCGGVFIDVFLLSVVDANQCFDRFNHTLGIAHEILVYILGTQPIRKACEKPRQVEDLSMGTAHCREAMAIG